MNMRQKDLDKFCYNNKERYWKYKNKDRKENKSKSIILNMDGHPLLKKKSLK